MDVNQTQQRLKTPQLPTNVEYPPLPKFAGSVIVKPRFPVILKQQPLKRPAGVFPVAAAVPVKVARQLDPAMAGLEEKCVSKLKVLLTNSEKNLEKMTSKMRSASNMLTKERKKNRVMYEEMRQLQDWLVETGKFGKVRDGNRYYVERLDAGPSESTSTFNFKSLPEALGEDFDPELLDMDMFNEDSQPSCSKTHVPVDVNPFAEYASTEDIVKKLETSRKETINIEVKANSEIDELRQAVESAKEEVKHLTEENRKLTMQLSNVKMEKDKVKEMQERHEDEWHFKYQSLEVQVKLIKEKLVSEKKKCRSLEALLSGTPMNVSAVSEIRQEDRNVNEKAKLLQVTYEMARMEKTKRKFYKEITPNLMPKYALETLQVCDSLISLLDAKLINEELRTTELVNTITKLTEENTNLKMAVTPKEDL